MKNFDLESKIKSVRVPERDAAFWQTLPQRVLARAQAAPEPPAPRAPFHYSLFTILNSQLALACLVVGFEWSQWFPLNKNLWTSSYVLVAAGWSLLVLTLAYWVVEQWGWGKGRGKGWVFPWLVFGSNAIMAYMFSELFPTALDSIHFTANGKRTNGLDYLYSHVFAHIPNPGWAAFAYSVTMTAICFLPVWFLYRKKIFIKV